MKRKILLLLMPLILCGIPTLAHDIEVNGIYYDINDTKLVVTYKGDAIGSWTLSSNVYSGSVVIPEFVTYNGKTYVVTDIGEKAFLNCTSLTSVTIPKSVKSIRFAAFSSCTALTSVSIPNSVVSIGQSAFKYCSSLTSITIPSSVTTIDSDAFGYNANLIQFYVDDKNPSYCSLDGVLYNKNKTVLFSYPGGKLDVSFTIPNSVTKIEKSAFVGCEYLQQVYIPSSVTEIGYILTQMIGGGRKIYENTNVFYGCKKLSSIVVDERNTKFNSIDNCNAIIETESGKLITGCKNTTIPNSVKTIGGKAFFECTTLTSIAIPNSVTSIEGSAFQYCTGLTSIIIPSTVISIGEQAFYGCNNLKKIFVSGGDLSSNVKGKLPSVIKYYMDDSFYAEGNNLYILDRTNYTAQLVNTTSQGNMAIPKSIGIEESGIQKQYNITSVAQYAMYGNQIYSLTIGENVKSVGNEVLKEKPNKTIWQTNTPPDGYSNAAGMINYVANDLYSSLSNKKVYPYISSIFEVDGIKYVPISPSERTCDAIDCLYDNTAENIHLSNEVSFKGISMKVNNIMDYICISNPYIKTLTIDSDHDIPLQAFKDCENLETVSLTNKGSIGRYAFSGCKKLNSVVLNNQGNVNDYAFSGCENLKTLDINNKGTIGSNSFEGCTNIETVSINNSGSIGQHAFANLKKLQTVAFGNNVTTLGDRSFSGCENLRAIDIPGNITSIGNYCFSGCSQLSNVTIGNGVKSIGSYAFSGCSNLYKITLGNSLTTIENYLLQNCSSLTDIEIPITVSRIGDYVLSGCTGLKKVIFKDSNISLSIGRNGSNPLFADCPLEYVYIGRDITYNTSSSYGYSPFYRNTTLRSVTFSDKETEISNYEFYGCSGLKNVFIGNGVTSIGDCAFSGCSSLESFSFGSNVKTIGKEAFSDCTAMTRLESHANTPPTCGSQSLDDINKWNCQLYVPETSLSAYQSADQWKDFFFINTLTVDPLLKDMLELRIKSDSLITSYNYGTIIENEDDLSEAAFTTPPTGLLTSATQLSSNAGATNEGSYEALLDGNQTTFFHTTWSSGKGEAPDEDHYLQIDLQEEVERIALKYGARGSTSWYVNPKDITIYATNNVNGNWTQITTATLTYDNNSNGKGLFSIDLGGKYRYIRISVQNSTLSGRTINGHAYWCLGELRIYNLGTGSQEGTGTEPQGNDEKPQVPKEVVENLQNCINAANSEIYSNVATQSTYDALLSAYNTFLSYMNESTDVERIYTNPSVDVWYDLQGRRITKPQTPGIYIHNGKKVWVK